jgi:hypothetical protein
MVAVRYPSVVRLGRLVLAAVSAAVLAGCGGSSPMKPAPKYTYGPNPSTSARMICRTGTINDLAVVLGVHTVARPTAAWSQHKYTCPYHYADGTMTLSVKALPTLAAAVAYVSAVRHELGDRSGFSDLGLSGFTTKNGSAVTRKDNKVLLVEVGQLPAMFGSPVTSRADVAITVTNVILACWRGD